MRCAPGRNAARLLQGRVSLHGWPQATCSMTRKANLWRSLNIFELLSSHVFLCLQWDRGTEDEVRKPVTGTMCLSWQGKSCVRAQLGYLSASKCRSPHQTSQECHLPGGRVSGRHRAQIPGQGRIAMGPWTSMDQWTIHRPLTHWLSLIVIDPSKSSVTFQWQIWQIIW